VKLAPVPLIHEALDFEGKLFECHEKQPTTPGAGITSLRHH